MAELKPVYLIHGDDDAKIDEWRTRIRRRAEAELGPGGLELFDAAASSPAEVAAALALLTFDTGTRYLVTENAGTWKAGDLTPLTDALGSMPPDTVLLLTVRGKPLKGLVKAVQAAGGQVREHAAPKPWEMPNWVVSQAREHGLRLDAQAAKALLAIVGPRQQRLVREIEKAAVALHPETSASVEEIEQLAAGESSAKAYDLADAVVAGDLQATVGLAEELAVQDERPSRLLYPIVSRLREVHRVVELLDAGLGEKDLAAAMKAPPWRVKKAVALARRADRETLRRAICRFADLELELRSGSSLDEGTAVTLALTGAAA
jgi:DNA polymerase III subunit delta